MVDIIEQLAGCLNVPEGSATESETEKVIREAMFQIQALRDALELVDDLGSFSHLLSAVEPVTKEHEKAPGSQDPGA